MTERTFWNSKFKIKDKKQLHRLRRMPLKGTKKKKRTKLPSIGKLKRQCDSLFSQWIRNRDKNTCVVCGAIKNIQCGHLIKRGKMATRFDELNCHALCASCNYLDQYEPWHYTNWFIKNYGAPMYQELYEKSKQLKQMKRVDWNALIEKYSVK